MKKIKKKIKKIISSVKNKLAKLKKDCLVNYVSVVTNE
jgi:hypothetical protein